MSNSAFELPQPHEPEDGTFEPEVDEVDVTDESKSDYSVEETNAKEGDATAPTQVEAPKDEPAPVVVDADANTEPAVADSDTK